MGYYEHLCALLEPLGVYATARGTYSGSELYAAGEALDRAAVALERAERESLPASAEDDGLRLREQLFPNIGALGTVEQRRRALTALLGIGGDGFTNAEIARAVAGCGIDARVEESGGGHVRISFPGCIGVPEEFGRIASVIGGIVPCHLAVDYAFVFLTWAAFEETGWTWQSLESAAQTWESLEVSVPQ